MGLRTLVGFALDPLDLLERVASRGDLVPFRIGHRRALFVGHPDLIRRVAVVERRNLARGYSAAVLRTVLGNGLLVSEGKHWEEQRQKVQPALRIDHGETGAAIGGALDRMLSGWDAGEIREIHEELRRLTLDVSARLILGIHPETASGPLDPGLEVMVAGQSFSTFSLVPGLRRLPTPTQRRAREGQRAIDALVARAIAQGDGRVLARLDGTMDRAALRDELVTLLFTAFDTTAAGLCWTLYALASQPALAERLRAAPEAIVDAVIRESLRLYPPVPIQARDVVTPFELEGTSVAAGTTILWSQWVVHRDPRWFDRPREFDPDRWSGGLEDRLHPFAYFPFGGGRRKCVGEDVGISILRAIVVGLVDRVRLELVDERPARTHALVTLRPRGGMAMRVRWIERVGPRA